jgi:hypothetical protein
MKSIDTLSRLADDSYSSEEYFERMLIFERLKSQKTGTPFMLILLDIGKLVKGKQTEKAFVLERLLSALNSSTREIDVIGWYMIDSIIGIICKNIHGKLRTNVTGRIKDNLLKEGVFHMRGNTAEAIKMLCLLYPAS